MWTALAIFVGLIGVLLVIVGCLGSVPRAMLVGAGLVLLGFVLFFVPSLTVVLVASVLATVLGIAMYAKGQGWGVTAYAVLPFGAVGLIVCAFAAALP